MSAMPGPAQPTPDDLDRQSQVEELGKLLSEREEEFYSYQNSATADDGMRHAAAAASPPPRRHRHAPRVEPR